LDAFATGLLQQVNGRNYLGTVHLSSRPDLELAKNIFVLERQRLFYILSWNYSIRYGDDANTTLRVAFGHDPSVEIPSPWVKIRDLLTKIPPRPKTDVGTGAEPTDNPQLTPPTPPPEFKPGQQSNPIVGMANLIAAYADEKKKAQKLTSTTLTDDETVDSAGKIRMGYVDVEPAVLLQQANQLLESIGRSKITLEEYTLARNTASENASDPVPTQVVVAYAAVTRAKQYFGSNPFRITKLMTGFVGAYNKKAKAPRQGKYGRQPGRFAATSKDPTTADLLIAQSVINGYVDNPIPPGAHYFDPAAAEGLGISSIGTVTKWGDRNAWVGEIQGIPTRKLFVMTPEADEGKRKIANAAGIKWLKDNGFS